MQRVEDRGKGEAWDRAMTVGDSLAELLAAGLRRREGVQRADWERTAAGNLPFHTFLQGLTTKGLNRNDESFWLDPTALNIVDAILPSLYLHLMLQFDNRKEHVSEQTFFIND
jgi:hypothetical protein